MGDGCGEGKLRTVVEEVMLVVVLGGGEQG